MKYLLVILAFLPGVMLGQGKYILISNSNVIDVSNGKLMKGTSVLIKDGLIEDVFTNKKFKLPPGTVVIDGAGKYVIPGMTDAHIHFFQSGGLYARPDAFDLTRIVPYEREREETFINAEDFLIRYLRMGITTVADVGGPLSNFRIRESFNSKSISPTVLVTGPLFSMVEDKPLDNGDPPIIMTTTIEAADALFDKLLPLKPDYIKIWYIVTPDLPAEKTLPIVQHIAKRTHDAKLKLAVHATELNTAELAVDAGADILVHSVDDEIVTEKFVKKLVSKNVSYIPTLVVYDGYYRTVSGNLLNYPADLYFANPFVYSSLSDPEHFSDKDLPPTFKQVRSMNPPPANAYAHAYSVMATNLKKLFDAGVNVVAGTDAGNVGTMHATSFIRELEAMKRVGLSNAAVLKTATTNSAECFQQNSGGVAKGKRADIVVLLKNPLDDISNLISGEYVIKSGKVIKIDTLIRETPEMLIQRQVNAYNARNLDAFIDTYADDVKLYNFPDSLIGSGKEEMRAMYGGFFKTAANLHCEIVERIKLGNTIIDHERVKFKDQIINAVAIYEVKGSKIVRVTFKE